LPEQDEVAETGRARGRLDAHAIAVFESRPHAVARDGEPHGTRTLGQEAKREFGGRRGGQGWLPKKATPSGPAGGASVRPGGGSTLTRRRSCGTRSLWQSECQPPEPTSSRHNRTGVGVFRIEIGRSAAVSDATLTRQDGRGAALTPVTPRRSRPPGGSRGR
jgi:hypothetical protein